MASDVTSESPDIVRPDVSPVARPSLAPPAGSPPTRRHRYRFMFIYGLLAVAVGAGVAGVALFASHAVNPGPAWSSWKPSGGGLGAAKQIAAHIAPGYRLPDGNQLVDIFSKDSAVSLNGQTIPIPFIVTRGPKGKVDQITQVGNGDTFTFSLCGLGQSCAIATGKPSVQRGTLVRREILELALYTFKYVSGVKHIVAFLPPPAGTQPTYVVYLQKDDLKTQLHTPLTKTLGPKVPLPSQITRVEQQRIDSLTESKTYKFGLSQTQQGDAVLVLSPLSA